MGSFKLIEPFIKKYKLNLIIYTICILLSYPLESIVIPEIFSSFFGSLKSDSLTNISNDIFLVFFRLQSSTGMTSIILLSYTVCVCVCERK